MTWSIIYQGQADYCNEHRLPNFLPSDGHCYSCNCNLIRFISLIEARTKLITGCPNCNSSWCE